MNNLERDPALVATDGATERPLSSESLRRDAAVLAASPGVEVLTPREVPLGGPRAMTVRRTLPQRRRSLIGAWCFVDHYGPDEVNAETGMRVPGHPHTGLQTVTWLFEGQIEHRDTLGTRLIITPGEVNLMTSGDGIAHSEYSTASTTRVHGAQLWIALPEGRRLGERAFEHYAPNPVALDGAVLKVFLGELAGSASPVRTWTRTVGAEIVMEPGSLITLDVDPTFEHGILIDSGDAELERTPGASHELLFASAGRPTLTIESGPTGARLLLIGGQPLGESIVMWWNFIGRDHDEIVAQRASWQRRVGQLRESVSSADQSPSSDDDGRFGAFPAEWLSVLPAPELPTVRLKPRE